MRNYWLYHALIVGIDEDKFWELTPKTIQVYFRAYEKKRKIQLQDIWLQGKYFMCAIGSAFDKKNKYPEMPYKEEEEKELSNDNEWLERQRVRAMQSFMAILNKKR